LCPSTIYKKRYLFFLDFGVVKVLDGRIEMGLIQFWILRKNFFVGF